MSAPPTPTTIPASTLSASNVFRRLASMFYESLLRNGGTDFGWIFPHIPFAAFAQAKAPAWLIQAHLFLLLLLYFAWFWLHGGQTLAMKPGRSVSPTPTAGPRDLHRPCFAIYWPPGSAWASASASLGTCRS